MGALSRRLEVEESCLAYETEGSMKAGAVQETQQSRDHGQKAAERRELARLAGPKWSSHDCERYESKGYLEVDSSPRKQRPGP